MGTFSRTGRHSRAAQEQAYIESHGCLPAPLLVQWLATLRCPLACPHCLAADGGTGPEEMPLEEAGALIDQAAELGVQEFLVTGGEPLVREDLPAVIAHLGRRGLSWSLNTACLPNAETRRAIEKNPPALAAVSLDGPAEVHDAFRGRPGAFAEALEAISYFAGLKGVRTVAGTTVTTCNFASLPETFRLVVASGAGSWGIHLPVPEGRARERVDLFLSRRQLGQLMRFVAARRNYFPVTMADEFGYCGDWEPLLRDRPFQCGAGVAQCVVLPDGSVVPCTTLDREASAGNVRDRPLGEIWREGFAELRHWKAAGRCAGCEYAPACGGGCWLQRRRGMECYREVWHVPAALRTAAGVAVCLGALASPAFGETPAASTAAKTDTAQTNSTGRPAWREVKTPAVEEEVAPGIERRIVLWYASQLPAHPGNRPGPLGSKPTAEEKVSEPAADEKDSAYLFLARMESGQMPEGLNELAGQIKDGLKTKERSLAYAALLWRAVGEWVLKHPDPAQRTAAEQATLRETLAALERATAVWRKEIFEKKLEPYLARDRLRLSYDFEMMKAYIPPPAWLSLVRHTDSERWGSAVGRSNKPAEPLESWLERHPYAESMQLAMTVKGTSTELGRVNAAGRTAFKDKAAFGIYDVLVMPEKPAGIDVLLEPLYEGVNHVTLPAKTELTYWDVLMVAYKQNEAELDKRWWRESGPELGHVNPLGLGAALQAKPVGHAKDPDQQYQVARWLAEFWLF